MFLKKVLTGEPGEQFMNCSLYDEKSFDEVTTWPIGCVTDSSKVGPGYRRFWEYRLSTINYFFPQSTKKFFEKINNTTMSEEDALELARKQLSILQQDNERGEFEGIQNGVYSN